MMIIAATTPMLVPSTRVAVTTAEKALASTESIAAPWRKEPSLRWVMLEPPQKRERALLRPAGTTAFAPRPSTGFNMFKCQGFQALCPVVTPRRHPRMADSAWR